MKKKRKILFIYVLRILTLSLFLSVFLLIIYFFLISGGIRKTQPRPPLSEQFLPGKKIEQQTKVRFVEFKGDLGRIEVKAERHLALDEQHYRLEGQVEIHDFGRRPELESWARAEAAVYDDDWTSVVLTGKVSIKRQGVVITADKVIYLRPEESLQAEGDVSLQFKRLSIEAGEMNYSFRDEVTSFKREVKVKWQPETLAQAPYQLQSESLFYDRKQHKGRLEGNVHFFQAENRGEAGWAEFLISDDELYVLRLELGGGVKGLGRREATRISLEASHLLVKPFVNSSRPHALEADGNCSLRLHNEESETDFAGEGLTIILDRWGKLRELKLDQEARWRRQNLATAEVLESRGEKVVYLPSKSHLEIKSPEKKAASLVSERVIVTAAEMTLNIDTQDLEAREEVQLAMKPAGTKQKREGSLFSEEKQIYGRAALLLYHWQQHRLVLEKGVRLWQEETSLQAEKVVLDSETQELEAHDGVKMVAVRKAKREASPLRLVQIAAWQLKYEPTANKLHFVGPCEMGAANWQVKSGEVVIYLAKDSADPERLEAKGKVHLTRNGTKAVADRGKYEWEEDVFILEGNPVLEDTHQGKIRGDKLTFHLTDGKILVENQGRERSLSVIKKEK